MSPARTTGRVHDWHAVHRRSGAWQQCSACLRRVRLPAPLSATCPGPARPAEHEPETPEQWREAVDAAKLWLVIDSARRYGLVRGNYEVDVARCEELLRRGAELGYL